MEFLTHSQLQTAFDELETYLVTQRTRTHLAMEALHRLSESMPLMATGLTSLMTLEQDAIGRIELLKRVRDDYLLAESEEDYEKVHQQLVHLSLPGLPAQAQASRVLN